MHAPPLHLQITPSRLLAGALALAHATAILCAIVFPPGWWMPGLASLALACSLVFHLRRDALQLTGDAVSALLLRDDGQCQLTLVNGDAVEGNIEGSTFVAPLLVVINVRPSPSGKRRSVVLMPDSAPAEDLRRVRVWLRHRARPDRPASGAL